MVCLNNRRTDTLGAGELGPQCCSGTVSINIHLLNCMLYVVEKVFRLKSRKSHDKNSQARYGIRVHKRQRDATAVALGTPCCLS